MQKLHFAKRVRVKLLPKSDASTGNSQLKEELSAEINKHKVNIDREAFKKTQAERDELKIAKMQYKARVK